MKIGIIGLGLIGGSLGLDLKAQGQEILGVSRKESTCQTAVKKGVADRASTDLSILSEAEIIIICTPIGKIVPTLEQLVPHLNSETIVSDVGSVKQPIVTACSQLWSNFIGGHPMAGTAEQGINAAQTNLFKGAAYVITPPEENISGIEKLKNIAESLGAKPYICSPEVHDSAVAWISHLPVMTSTSLISACLGETEPQVLELAQHLASSGFRDTSRVGGGNPELGTMMAQYNRKALLRSLQVYRQNLDKIINLIEQKNWDNLEQILNINQEARPKFLN
ncbi:MAG: prephenate/arogenate dehydrogenase [Xenococcaceae cyanobacterium MO_207.B15]|nr:prephenate/arogenate dehydrogenase [Xenococcaceae cyanobacterium MO_207.B15]